MLFNKEELIKQTNYFILILFFFFKNKENNNKYLTDDIKNSLINFLSIKFHNNNYHLNIITDILFDNHFFNQKEINTELKESIIEKLDASIFNKGILYNVFLTDYVFLLKNVKHKKLLNFFNSSFSSKNKKLLIKELVNYIINIKNEIKIYHYLKLIYNNLSDFQKELELSEKNKFFVFLDMNFKNLKNEHCKYCLYSIILSFLIKDDLLKSNHKNNGFDITYGYMSSPSFLFIRAIFTQTFNFSNSLKFEFIKCKNKNLYSMDFFDSMKINPYDILDNKTFILRFNEIIKYCNYLMKLENIKAINNIIENFFNFIQEFINKIININSIMTNKKQIISFIDNLFYSKANNNFFIIFLKYNEEEALKTIKNYINTYLPYFFKTILYILSPKIEIGNLKKSNYIKNYITNDIISELLNNKHIQIINENENLISLLIILYNNMSEDYLTISSESSNNFIKFFTNLLKQNSLLNMKPINVNYNDDEKNRYIEDINDINKNNMKFIYEIILEMIIKIIFNDKNCNDKSLSKIITNKNNVSIFYINDDENLKKDKDKISHEKKNNNNFIEENNYFSFCLYYLIFFFNKYNLYKSQNKDEIKVLNDISGILFNDLKKIYSKGKKIVSILKKTKYHGKNFELYNTMLSICSKHYKESKFNLKFLFEKFSNLKLIKNEIIKHETFHEYDSFVVIDDINPNKNKKKIIRSKSFEKNISQKMNERLLEELDMRNTIFNLNLEEDIFNQSMISNVTLNIIDNDDLYDKNPKSNDNLGENENYLKKELSKFNQFDYYYTEIINKIGNPEDIKMLFNPKEYYIWKRFSIVFKDLIFNNKKFKRISKAYEIHIKDKKIREENDENLYLNYPTKLKNYIVDDYYRPFLKPSLTFFKNKYIIVSHPYIKKNLLINSQFKEDNFLLIEFKKIFLSLINEKMIECERIKNKGNVFGYLNFSINFMLFINSPEDDARNTNNLKKRLEYIYSIKEDIMIDKNMYTLIFYKDIKEIIKRRFCFNYIGYEIFMKDNRCYLFNFFNKQNASLFLKEINNRIQEKKNIKINKNNNNKNQEDKKAISNNSIIDNNFKIIEDPISEFKKIDYKSKYKRGEISNFKYLLLLNKFSSRTYNDNNQYLVFPLLFLEESRNKKRDLSKSISLNKDDKAAVIERIMNNKTYMGYYFTQHFSTSGYLLFYLLRLNPFTYSLIELQSGKFDLPERLFSSLKNLLAFLNTIQENRELIPEFFYNYEFLINLNRNDFGKIKIRNEYRYINNLDTNKKNETFVQFIIYMKNALENEKIPLWIDNIFGLYQFNNSEDHPNSYPLYTYESNCDLDKIKEKMCSLEEKIDILEQKVSILKLGMCPAQLFNKPHPKMVRSINNEFENESNNFSKKEQKIIELIEKFLEERKDNEFYLIRQNNFVDIELIIAFNKKIDILIINFGECKYGIFSINIGENLDERCNNIICKIFPRIYCIIGFKDNTIKFISLKDILEIYQWTSFVSSITLFIQNNKEENIQKIILGDEKGYLHVVNVEIKLKNEKSEEINAKIIKSVKVQRTLIKGIIHNKRLNIIISWSDEGIISINNDYSFNFLNIIDLGKNYDIKDIFISHYDLIYINCYNFKNKKYELNYYTLNGIKSKSYESSKKIVNFYYDEDNIIMVNENKNIFTYNCYDLYNLKDIIFCDYKDNYTGNQIHIKYCNYYQKIKKMLIIFNNNKIQFHDIKSIITNK